MLYKKLYKNISVVALGPVLATRVHRLRKRRRRP